MKRALATALAATTLPLLLATPSLAEEAGRPAAHLLTGDDGGSKFEGIGVDTRRGLFYVSEVTGGEIHRGSATRVEAQEWLGAGADGRFTARGITVDDAGRVYVAGGPNGLGTGRPDVWVYSPEGDLLAALRLPGDDVFANDVAIGPDGAAYVTNSNAPQVFRVAFGAAGWEARLWSDASGVVDQLAGFNLGGIVVSPDRSALVVAQGNAGLLWRFDLADASVSAVATGGADLVNADGLVLQGGRLNVVRNFSRMLASLHLSADGRSASAVAQEPTDPARVLTTAKVLHGRILYVDSKFDEAVASGPYEVVTTPLAP